MPTALITGASQGLGLEFVRQYATDGWSVIACCREPGRAPELQSLGNEHRGVILEPLDITDHPAVDQLAARLQGKAIDVLINNAGIMGALPYGEHRQRQHFGSIDYTLWNEVFTTNTLGTVKMAEAFVEHVAASGQRKIVNLSSTTGSITESKRQALAYTTSKAALNKAMTLVAEVLRSRSIIVALLCPGYVKTRMNVGGATVEIKDSVAGMRRVIDALTLNDSGSFRRYNGETIAW